MTDAAGLPPGFTLDAAPAAAPTTGLPPGFTLDAAPTTTPAPSVNLGIQGALLNSMTGGLANDAAAAFRAGVSHLTSNPTTYAEAKAKLEANATAFTAEHPLLNAAADVGGAIIGGAGVAKGVGAGLGATVNVVTRASPTAAQLVARVGAALAPELSVDGQAITAAAKLRNVGRMALAGTGQGAAAGGIYGAIPGVEQGNPAGAATGAAAGAAEGALVGGAVAPVVGAAIAGALKLPDYFSGQWDRAATLLGKTFDMPATDIQKALTVQAARTGEPVAMADIATLNNTGDLALLAKSYKPVGNAVEKRQQAVAAALPTALSNDVAGTLGPPERVAPLEEFRDANMTRVMDQIRNTPIDLGDDDLAFLTDPQIKDVIGGVRAGRREAPMSADKLAMASKAQTDNATLQALLSSGKATAAEVNAAGAQATKSQAVADANPMTLDDIDNFREQLRNRQASLNSPTSNAHDRLAAQVYGDRASRVAQMGDAVPGYTDALAQYADDQQHIAGFTHGFTGALAAAARGDVRRALASTPGQQGYQAGLRSYVFDLANKGESAAAATANRLSENNELTQNLAKTFGVTPTTALQTAARARASGLASLQAISPGTSQATEGGLEPAQIMQGALAVAHPMGPWAWFHAVKATIPGLKLSNNGINYVAQMLADPAMAPKVPGILAQAGAKSNEIRTLMRTVSGLAAAGAGAGVGDGTPGP